MIVYAVIVLIVIALNEMLKRIGILPTKIIPLSNVLMSICLLLAYTGIHVSENITIGFFIGVFTTGIYSSVKNFIHWIKIYKT